MKIAEYSAKIISKTRLTPDLLELHFRKPADFAHAAGQFVQFHIPDGGKFLLRSFSLSSSPTDADLEFCVKLLPEGKASGHFLEMNVGESIVFQGPVGRFTATERNQPMVFVATGAGLAPIISIIRDELENKKNQARLDLLFGVRHHENAFWIDRLERLQKQFLNFHYALTLSRPGEHWNGKAGRVTAHVNKFIDSSREHFLCGSGEMVKEVRQMLLDAGVDAKRMHLEIF